MRLILSHIIRIRIVGIILVLTGFWCSSQAQDNYTFTEVKAAFILSFPKYIEWPYQTISDEFVIGVLSSDKNLYEALKKLSKQIEVKNKTATIVHFKTIEEVTHTNELYIDHNMSIHFGKLSGEAKKNSTLIVSDDDHSSDIMINFIYSDADRSFEVNEKNLVDANFLPSDKLVRFANSKTDWQELYIKSDENLQKEKLTVRHQQEELSLQQLVIKEKSEILLEMEQRLQKMKDSVYEQVKSISDHERTLSFQQYGILEQDKRIAAQKAVLDQQISALRKQELILYLFIILFVVLIGFGYFIIRSYRIKKKVNIALEEKNRKITKQNEEINEQKTKIEIQRDEILQRSEEVIQQKEEIRSQADHLATVNTKLVRTNHILTDSIGYAKKIQSALLPSTELISESLHDFFILFKPRDIVSGDFYWYLKKGDLVYFAAVDCTGHGVPGAFMSMIGGSLLNQIVNEKKYLSPAKILVRLDSAIVYNLSRGMVDDQSQDDGMDITLCIYNETDQSLKISCANHFAYIIQDEIIKMIEGSNFSIGGTLASHVQDKYKDEIFDCKQDLNLYIFSDGYQDQFGGSENNKFGRTAFQKLLYENHKKPMTEQKKWIDQQFLEWKMDGRQIDDVLVFGIKFLRK